jgi:hypothetical protein
MLTRRRVIVSAVVAVQAAAAIVAGATAAPPPGPGPHPHYGQVARQVACQHSTNPAFCSDPGLAAQR